MTGPAVIDGPLGGIDPPDLAPGVYCYQCGYLAQGDDAAAIAKDEANHASATGHVDRLVVVGTSRTQYQVRNRHLSGKQPWELPVEEEIALHETMTLQPDVVAVVSKAFGDTAAQRMMESAPSDSST